MVLLMRGSVNLCLWVLVTHAGGSELYRMISVTPLVDVAYGLYPAVGTAILSKVAALQEPGAAVRRRGSGRVSDPLRTERGGCTSGHRQGTRV